MGNTMEMNKDYPIIIQSAASFLIIISQELSLKAFNFLISIVFVQHQSNKNFCHG
jgi:hypothetical protein